jgi:hypothetical protein
VLELHAFLLAKLFSLLEDFPLSLNGNLSLLFGKLDFALLLQALLERGLLLAPVLHLTELLSLLFSPLEFFPPDLLGCLLLFLLSLVLGLLLFKLLFTEQLLLLHLPLPLNL